MVSSIIVHAGANKTGSSAIQTFLAQNHDRLLQCGVLVPDESFAHAQQVPGHHVFAFQRLLDSPTDARPQFEAAIDALARSEPAKTIVLSAENLAANPKAASLFEGLAGRYDVRLIMYVRRQDQYLLSSWRQWHFKVRKDFWAWLIREVGSNGDWRRYLESWERVLPRDKISVRVYEPTRLADGDVVSDFYGLLELATPISEMERSDGTVNPSLSDAVTDLVGGNPLVFRDVHDNDFQNFVVELTGERYLAKGQESRLTLEQRQAILVRYEASNRWVQEHYFPGQEGDLFTPPAPAGEVAGRDPVNVQLEFLATLVYNMYREQAENGAPSSGSRDPGSSRDVRKRAATTKGAPPNIAGVRRSARRLWPGKHD